MRISGGKVTGLRGTLVRGWRLASGQENTGKIRNLEKQRFCHSSAVRPSKRVTL
jgi:hypothetical protein